MSNILIKKNDIDLSINSKIKDITIYSNKAIITRYIKANLNKGENILTFNNLGVNIEEQSIKASLDIKNAKISSISLQQNFLYFFKEDEHEKTYNDLIKNLKKAIQLIDFKSISALENIILQDLKEYIQDTLNNILLEKDISIAKLRESLDFISAKLNENSLKINKNNNDIDKINEILEIQKDKLKKIRALDKKIQNNIEVSIESDKQTEGIVEINYTLPNVYWKASYDAFLNTNTKEVELIYYGEINQTTNEDWKNAKIILSSSEVEQTIKIPEIFPVNLSGFIQKRDKELELEEKVTKKLEDEIAIGAISEEESGENPDDTIDIVDVEKKDIFYKFIIQKPYSIPSDNNWHKIIINKFKFKPKLFYETVPEYLEYIYLKGEFKNETKYPLLQGKVMIFRNNSYMGRTKLKYISLGETFSISFGIDEDLKVKRITYKNKYTPAKGLSNKNIKEWEYQYILYNYKDKQEKITLKESIYLSELKEVSVKIHDDTTIGFNKDKDSIVSWEVTLPPEKFKYKKIILHYSLISKKEFDISRF